MAEKEEAPGRDIVITSGSMGLKGIWSQVANLTAVALICVLFYQGQNAAIDAAKEDRALFRDAVSKLEHGMTVQAEEMKRLGDATADNTAAIRRILTTIRAFEKDKEKPQ